MKETTRYVGPDGEALHPGDSTVQSRGPAENLLFSITPWLTAGKDRHYYAAAVSA